MAVGQIFDPNMRGTGHRFGESVEQGIQGLLNHKLQQMDRQRQEQSNYDALIAGGVPEQQARGYAKASPEVMRNVFSDIFSRYGTGGIIKPTEQQAIAVESEPYVAQQTQQSNPQADLLQQLMGQAQQKTGQINPQQALMQALQGGNFNSQQGQGALSGEQGLIDYLKGQQLQQPSQQAKPMQPTQQPAAVIPIPSQTPTKQGLAPGVPPTRQEARALAHEEQQERQHQEKIEQRREEASKKDIREAYAFNKDFTQQTQKEANIGRKTNTAYNTIYDLAKSGDVRSGGWFKTLDTLGLNEFYRNPATQLAQKEIASLAQGAAAAFNTPRLNAMEVDLYQDSLLKMGNTPESMMTIAKNKILEGDSLILRDNMRKQIIKENNGKPPYDLSDQVYERVEPNLSRMAQISQDNVNLTVHDKSLADATAYSPDTIIRVDGIEYQPQGKYWVRVGNGS